MAHRLLALALLAASLAYTVLARRIPMDAWTAEEAINAQTLPTVYGVVLSLVLLAALFRRSDRSTTTTGTAIAAGRGLRLLGVTVLVLAFITLIGWLNLWLALGVLLFAAAWWLGERRWLTMLTLAVAVPLAGYLGIELGLGVYLPD